MKKKKYTFSPVSDVNVEESCFLKAELKTPHQQLLIFLSFMNTFFKTKK